MEIDNISEFYDKWFVAHQEFVSDDTGYEIKFVRNSVEYLKIKAFKATDINRRYIRLSLYNPLDFKVTPDEFNKLLFMLAVIYEWHSEDELKFVADNIEMGTLDFLHESYDNVPGRSYCMLFSIYYHAIKDKSSTKRDVYKWFKSLTNAWDRMTDHLANEQAEEAEEDTEMKDLSTDNVRIFSNVSVFALQFYLEQAGFIHDGTSFKNMLFSHDTSVKYISIAGYNGSQINVTFHETPHEIELEDVISIVKLMRTLLKVSYSGGEYGVEFNYRPYPDDMLSYIKDLLDHTPARYVECIKKYEELEQDEEKYLYELYERAYMFLGKWLDFAEKWQEQHDSESNSNYYTDDKGQDMFAKFESLDDFREQTYALGFCYHNIEKYLVRAGRKTNDPTEDINKALDYLHEYRKLHKIYFE